MKKISIILAVVAAMLCLSVTAFASDAAPFTFATDNIDVALGEGTQSVDVTLNVKFDTDAEFYLANITFDTDGLAVENIDSSALATYVPVDAGGSDVEGGMINHIDMTNFTPGTIPAGTVVPVVLRVTVDKSVEATYDITLTTDTMFVNTSDEPINDCETYPTMTITVKAAGPVAVAGTKKFDATFDASDIIIDGVKYQDVAVINGSAKAPVLATGESITKVGIEYDGTEVKDLTSISGGGDVTYRVLFYGITDAEAEALAAKVKTFYTGIFFPAN